MEQNNEMQLSKTTNLLNVVNQNNIQQQLTRHENELRDLRMVQNGQSEQIQRLSMVVGQLRSLVRQLFEGNERLKRQIGGLLLAIRLGYRRKQRVDYRFWSTILSVVMARLVSRFLLVDTMAYMITLPLPKSMITPRTARQTVSLVSTMALVVYLKPKVEQLISL